MGDKAVRRGVWGGAGRGWPSVKLMIRKQGDCVITGAELQS